MTTLREIREVLREAHAPLDAGLIADILGADRRKVEALLARLERDGIAHHHEEWTLA